MKMKFNPGSVYVTKGVNCTLSTDDICKALERHINGDWGELCPEDRKLNDTALTENDGRIMSAYISSDGIKFWVITEADRSCTTVLLPEEY